MSQSISPPSEPRFFRSRDWHIPWHHWFNEPPLTGLLPRGRRSTTVTAANYKAGGRGLYLSTQPGANQVYVLAEFSVIFPTPNGQPAASLWDQVFALTMSMNQTSVQLTGPNAAAGECLQGFGIGDMSRDTPWIGFNSPGSSGSIVHLRWNSTRQIMELFAAGPADLGNTVDLAIQPNFAVDNRIPEFTMLWTPPDTMRIYCNGALLHTQAMSAMLPLDGGVSFSSGQLDLAMFLTNGSNALTAHVEAGFYDPRFWQPLIYQPAT